MSPTRFNIFLEKVTDTLEDHIGIVSVGGRKTNNLCFCWSMAVAEKEQELSKGVEYVDKTSAA